MPWQYRATIGGGTNWLTVQAGGLRDGADVFRFAGANIYWLALNDNTRDVDNNPTYPTSQQVDDTLDQIVTMGGQVVRVHTLGISVGKPKTMMPTLGNWDATAVDKADYVVSAAKSRGLRLMVPLCDRWDFYHGGGLSFCRMRSLTEDMATFYGNATVRQDFKDYISTLLNHVNPYTGLAWKDDPTLAIWETGNEVWDATEDWHNDVTAHITSLAPNALVADGTAASGRHILATQGFNGTDAPGLDDPNTDIVGGHFYDSQRRDVTWLTTDAAAATAAGKAYIVGEYDWIDGDNNGITKSGGATRAAWLQAIRDNGDVAGDLMWTLCLNGIGDHRDGYELYRPTAENAEQAAGWTDFAAHAPLMADSTLTP